MSVDRGQCWACYRLVPMRRDGKVREHFDGYLPQADQRPDVRNGRMMRCPGSGLAPRDLWRRDRGLTV